MNNDEATVADTTAVVNEGTQETRQNIGVWRVNPDKVISLSHAFPDRLARSSTEQQKSWHRDVLAVCELVLGAHVRCTNHMTCIVATLPALQVQVKPHKIHTGYYAVKAHWPLTMDTNGVHGKTYDNVNGYVLCEELSHYLGDILMKLPVQ